MLKLGDLFKTSAVEELSPFMTIVVCSVFCLCTLVAYIANTMDPDQTAPLGAVWSGS